MSKIFVTSDWHFCHNQPFIYEPRGFSSVQEMNEAIIKRHNEVVTSDDVVYCLGDCMLNDDKEGINCIRRLNGNKIYLISGNHDTSNRIQQYANIDQRVVNLGYATILKYKNFKFYLSHYPTLTDNHDENKPLKRKIINLCGHKHTADSFEDWDKGLIYHCEMDAHNCYPILLDYIIENIILTKGEK